MIYVRLGGKNIEIFKVLFKICFFIINLPTYFLLNLNERQKNSYLKKISIFLIVFIRSIRMSLLL